MVTLEARALSVTLGRHLVLDRIDATMTGGECIGIVGPNGAGKSTLLRALLGLVQPKAGGAVLLDGEPLGRLRRNVIARRLSYLPQGQIVHWPLTAERVVALGRLPHLAPFSAIGEADRAAIERAMAMADVLPLRDRPINDLSGGERGRVLIARALAVDAPALLVDEPLAALDPRHAIEVMAVLAAIAQAGRLVIVVLHDLSQAARWCDRLVLLHKGRVQGDGLPGAVLTERALEQVFGIRAWTGMVDGAPAIVPIAPV